MPVESKLRRRAPRVSSGRPKIKQHTIAGQQADLLRLVRARDGLSRVELARSLNLAPSTVGIYVNHLVEEGYLFEGKTAARDFGRPPTILALNPQGGFFRTGANVYGLQFHFEVTPAMIEDWCAQSANCGDVCELEAPIDPQRNAARLTTLASVVFGRWCDLL